MTYRCGVPVLLLVLFASALLLRHAAKAQVTFSRDWTAGKRSAAPVSGGGGTVGDCTPNRRSVAALCHMLMGELRQLTSCEMRAQLSARDDEMLVSASGGAPFPLRSRR